MFIILFLLFWDLTRRWRRRHDVVERNWKDWYEFRIHMKEWKEEVCQFLDSRVCRWGWKILGLSTGFMTRSAQQSQVAGSCYFFFRTVKHLKNAVQSPPTLTAARKANGSLQAEIVGQSRSWIRTDHGAALKSPHTVVEAAHQHVPKKFTYSHTPTPWCHL